MEEAEEFQDWEVLKNSETSVFQSPDRSRDLLVIEGDSEDGIRSDYFDLDSEKRYARPVSEVDDQEVSVDSDNPSWIDPSSEPRYGDFNRKEVGFEGIAFKYKNSGEFWSDSGSDGSVSQKFRDFEGKHQLVRGDDSERGVGFEGIGGSEEFEVKNTDFGEFWSDSGGNTSAPVKFVGVEGEDRLGLGDSLNMEDGSEFSSEVEAVNELDSVGDREVGGGDELVSARFVEGDEGETPEEIGNVSSEDTKLAEGEKKGMVWWKLPLELMKFCIFRVSPIWTFSIAGAVMGFVILGRRLRRMRRKSRSSPLKVTFEGKKVSQLMIHATRLNEAFSVVRRVPTIRPLLPTGGLSPCPTMSLR